MDPATLSAAAIATLVITKAFEKTGEVLGEKALSQGGKLVRLLKERFPKADSALALALYMDEHIHSAITRLSTGVGC